MIDYITGFFAAIGVWCLGIYTSDKLKRYLRSHVTITIEAADK